jgi:alpha-beta hydrolase superfamily lysophospholipase
MKFNVALLVGLIGLGAALLLNRLKVESDDIHSWPPQDEMEVSQDTLGPNGFTKEWTNDQGYKIFSIFWPTTVKKPKGILLLLHGHGVHVIFEFMKSSGVGVERKYEKSWIQELNKQGYSCCGIDVQSKGRSEGFGGMQSFFNSFDDVVSDELAFISKMPELGGEAFKADLPIFPFAVSMGGARAVKMILRNESLFKAALFYAPMLSLERVSKQGLNPYMRPLTKLISSIGPTWRLVKGSTNEMYPDLQDEFNNDRFSDAGMTRVRVAAEYLRVTTEIMDNLEKITLPFVTFHADGDNMVDPEGSRQLVAKASSKIKRYENCPNSWHILIHEPGNEITLQKTIDFLNEVNT